MLDDSYQEKRTIPSDINEHLPTLKEYASKCSSVVECGVRGIVSSHAFANGLRGVVNNSFVMIDPYVSDEIGGFIKMCKDEGVNASFVHQSDLECALVETDLLFIDTWHVYGQLKRELARWNSSVKKYIIMHDTTVDEWVGETIRNGWDADKQSAETGFPKSEIMRGLWPAVEEFLAEHPEWKIEKRYTNNNGLTILARVAT
jgi:cephalosporin hydroxylase